MLGRRDARLFFTVLAVCCTVSSHIVVAQSDIAQTPIVVSGRSNEESKAGLALLAQTVKDDEFVILIARLGNGESARKINRRRLQVVRSYLDVTRTVPFPTQKVVTAEGEPSDAQGRIEVYLRGKLFMVFIFDTNKNFAPES